MKKTITILMLLLSVISSGKENDTLKKILNRYDYDRAVVIIDSLLNTNADKMELALQKARCLRKLYRVEEAIQTLSEVIKTDLFNIELMAELAECHLQAGNTEEAFRLYSLLAATSPDNVYFKLRKAKILYQEKMYIESINVGRNIIRTDTIPEVLSMIGDSYKKLNNTDSALAYYDTLLKLKPKHAITISKKADILLGRQQYTKVIEITSEYLREHPDDMRILPICGIALYLDKQYSSSIDTFEHQAELGDDSYAIHYYLGMNHYKLGDKLQAYDEFLTAYQTDSSDVSLVLHLAETTSYLHNGATAESERLFEKALQMTEADQTMMSNIYGSRAMSFHKKEDYLTAIKYYELSYKYLPSNISILSSIGYCYERLKEYEKALKYYEEYLRSGTPGTKGYEFVEDGIRYLRQEIFMNETR